jgi:hypothetical protein
MKVWEQRETRVQFKLIGLGPRVDFLKTRGQNAKIEMLLILHAGLRSDGAGTTDFRPVISRPTRSVPLKKIVKYFLSYVLASLFPLFYFEVYPDTLSVVKF